MCIGHVDVPGEVHLGCSLKRIVGPFRGCDVPVIISEQRVVTAVRDNELSHYRDTVSADTDAYTCKTTPLIRVFIMAVW